MQDATQAVAAVNKAGLEASLSIAQIAVNASEKLAKLQFEAGKALLEESFASARSVATVKVPTDLFLVRENFSTAGFDKWIGYSKNVFGIAQAAQTEAAAVAEKHVAAVQKDVVAAIEKAVAQSPIPGADQAVVTLKGALSSAAAAVDAVKTLVKQTTEFAEAGMKVAATQGESLKSAAKRAH
jgi:phasin family protein